MSQNSSPDQAEIIASAIANIGELSTLPQVTIKVIQLVDDPLSDSNDLHDVIRHDPALAARVLRVVNSAFCGVPAQVASLERAISLLGLAAVKNIAVSASMSHVYGSGPEVDGLSGKDLWQHAVADAVAARLLAPKDREEYFLTGLIADLGLLVERQLFGQELGRIVKHFRAHGGCFCELERAAFGADHHAFGMALARKWEFPERIYETIGRCHEPLSVTGPIRLTACVVNLADILACRAGIGFCTLPGNTEITPTLLDAAGVTMERIESAAEQLPEQFGLANQIFTGVEK